MKRAEFPFEVHLLDVGTSQYGDSILCVCGGQTILIDGGHANNTARLTETIDGAEVVHPSLPDQMRQVLGVSEAHSIKVDLLVVTHCHSDHIGCLPKLFESGELTCEWALMAHPALGFGLFLNDPAPDTKSVAGRLSAALREEPLLDGDDEEILRLVSDAADLYSEYVGLLVHLERKIKDNLVWFFGPDSPGLQRLTEHFAPSGLRIHGPSQRQLLLCAEAISVARLDAIAPISDSISTSTLRHGDSNEAALYRQLVAIATEETDSAIARLGTPVNNQSIVLSVGCAHSRALLTGDIQLAVPEMGTAVQAEMTKLIEELSGLAPFDFVKLPHHGSSNGIDESQLRRLCSGWSGISTGSRSLRHPSKVLIDALRNSNSTWVRTDRNGRSGFAVHRGRRLLMVSRGESNDGTWTEPKRPLTERSVAKASRHNWPPPHPSKKGNPQLLFVTNEEDLSRNIGREGSKLVLDEISLRASELVIASRGNLRSEVTEALRKKEADGVVLIGGYDVVPSRALDTLPPDIRQRLRLFPGAPQDPHDDYRVWNDDFYGDWNNDGVPEVPVSRIPDGRDAQMILRVLQSHFPGRSPLRRRGIRNHARPYGDQVFDAIVGEGELLRSVPVRHDQQPPYNLQTDILYLLLHGSYEDGTYLEGEDVDTRRVRAMTLSNVPNPGPSLIFSTCCWGALTVDGLAKRPTLDPVSRTADKSIALSFLARGANAFVGCTGAHYSPRGYQVGHGGPVLHQRFLHHLSAGAPPARALFDAKHEYAEAISSLASTKSELYLSFEHKTLWQFTCLGLGW